MNRIRNGSKLSLLCFFASGLLPAAFAAKPSATVIVTLIEVIANFGEEKGSIPICPQATTGELAKPKLHMNLRHHGCHCDLLTSPDLLTFDLQLDRALETCIENEKLLVMSVEDLVSVKSIAMGDRFSAGKRRIDRDCVVKLQR